MYKHIDFILKHSENVVFVSENQNLLHSLNDDNSVCFLLKDINTIDSLDIYSFFIKYPDHNLLLINDTTDEDLFSSTIVNRAIEFFDLVKCRKNNIILYCARDFKFKKQLRDFTTKGENSKNSILINTDNINYIGQSGTSGYAQAAKMYIYDHIINNKTVSWHPLYFDKSKDDNYFPVDVLASSVKHREIEDVDLNILHCTPDLWKPFSEDLITNDSHTVGYTVWESDKLPDSWVKDINYLTEVWVPSEFNRKVFIESGVKADIKVVPHIFYNSKQFDKSIIRMYDFLGNEIPKDKFVFYNIGEFHTRKGIEDLVIAFDRLYEENKNIILILKLHYKGYTSENILYCLDKLKKITNNITKSIFLIFKNLSHNEMLALHSIGDSYVSLNKGEGFGLPIFDAYNYDKYVIATKYGGPLDFLTDPNKCDLVDCEIKPIVGMEDFSKNYTPDQSWAYPSIDHGYELMKKIV